MNKKILSKMNDKLFLTDGGLETVLIFNHDVDLPHFASFPLLDKEEGKELIINYYKDFINTAKKYQKGFILESPTWRANPVWGFQLGYDKKDLERINKLAIKELIQLKYQYEDLNTPILVSGCIGPRGDGYSPDNLMGIDEAENYHSFQISCLKYANADMITALTINNIEEAVGIARAAKKFEIPVAISFTVETDGNLPSGDSLHKAITIVDNLTNNYVEYFMINCAHPTHFKNSLISENSVLDRIQGVRSNASKKSHEELDNSTELDSGDKVELAKQHIELLDLLPNLKVIGGCCGTDHNHIEEICEAISIVHT